MNDPLEPLLGPPPVAHPDFRERLRLQTSQVLRRRRRVHRLTRLATCAACLLAVALWWWQARLPQAIVPDQAVLPTPTPAAAKEQTAVALEWQAFDSPEPERAAHYLAAGNQYVEETQDYAAALRCYEQALADQQQEIRPDDNWLVMALKMDQKRREN